MTALIVVLSVLVLLGLLFASSARVVQQYERGVLFRLGRVQQPVRAPGLNMIVPVVDHLERSACKSSPCRCPRRRGSPETT
jgi:regulator of protease activity HflC (stomatin/prohibitin superfamily)